MRKKEEKVTTELYVKEIERLKQEVAKYRAMYETANKYKDDYETLVEDAKKKMKEIESLKKMTLELNNELQKEIDKLRKE